MALAASELERLCAAEFILRCSRNLRRRSNDRGVETSARGGLGAGSDTVRSVPTSGGSVAALEVVVGLEAAVTIESEWTSGSDRCALDDEVLVASGSIAGVRGEVGAELHGELEADAGCEALVYNNDTRAWSRAVVCTQLAVAGRACTCARPSYSACAILSCRLRSRRYVAVALSYACASRLWRTASAS
jgi:hypothetical protein